MCEHPVDTAKAPSGFAVLLFVSLLTDSPSKGVLGLYHYRRSAGRGDANLRGEHLPLFRVP